MLQTQASDGALFQGNVGPCALVDVETTGLAAADHRVLSVTVLTIEPTGELTGEFHTLIDPGPDCDPGPVHVHGLTRERLSGAPRFEAVLPTLASLFHGRTLIAHNAQFDYDFIDEEFRRCGAVLPVARRMCTLALARRVAPPTPDCRLGSLANYYEVPQLRAHDSLDDTRVLVGVLRGLLADAHRMGLDTPILTCPPTKGTGESRYPRPRTSPKKPCQFINPGRVVAGKPLVQGMKIAITGDTSTRRAELTSRGDAAGLDMVGAVSKQTSLLVTNEPLDRSSKARRAVQLQTPIVDEAAFLSLLSDVQPGVTKGAQQAPAAERKRPATKRTSTPTGPLSGRRILVLGGTHDNAAVARARIAELGGSAAVNMSGSVTDVIALTSAAIDPRHAKARELGLPIYGPELLAPDREQPAPSATATTTTSDAVSLSHGQVIDLPIADFGAAWTFRASWTQTSECEVDLVAFLVDDNERVSSDDDFVFYNQPDAVGAQLTADGPNEQTIAIRLDALPEHCRRIVIAAAIDGDGVTFGDVGAIEIDAAPGPEAANIARATLDAATTERSLRLAEVYLRGDTWRLRSVGQGYETGLSALAKSFGVQVDDD